MKGAGRNGGDAHVAGEKAVEVDVVREGVAAEAGADEVGAGGGVGLEAGRSEGGREQIAARAQLVAQAGDVARAVFEGLGAGELQGRRGGERGKLVGGADGGAQIGRGEGPADAPAGEREGLAHARDADGAFGHAGQGGNGEVLAVVDEVFVDLVGDADDVVAAAKLGDEGEFFFREDLTGGVMGAIEDEHAGLVAEGGGERVGVEAKVGRLERDDAGGGPGEGDGGAVAVVKGLEEHDLVARVAEAEQGGEDHFGGAAADGDAELGVVVEAVGEATAAGEGGAQLGHAGRGRVLAAARFDRGDRRPLDELGAVEIGEALRQIDGPGLVGEPGHFGEDCRAEAGELARQPRPARARATHRPSLGRGGPAPSRGRGLRPRGSRGGGPTPGAWGGAARGDFSLASPWGTK